MAASVVGPATTKGNMEASTMRDIAVLQRVFRALPGLYLVLRPDPVFTIVAASDDYLVAVQRDEALFGRPLSDLFPDDPGHPGSAAAVALRASLRRVADSGDPERMPVQAFQLPGLGLHASTLEERLWLPLNTPVRTDAGEVEFIVHQVQEAAAKANQDAIGILNSITEGFYTLDRRWRFDFVNREAERILGRSLGELAGRVVWEAYPGLEGTDIERRYLLAMHERRHSSFTAFYAGHDRWYDITVAPAPEGISVYFRDVTEQKAVQDQRDALLQESERQRRMYETALDSTPDLVSIYDTDRRVLYANAALLRTWGLRDARGKRLCEIGYAPALAEAREREFDQVIASQAPVQGESALAVDGQRRLFDYIFAPVIGAGGEVVAVAGTARDITERTALTARLSDSQRMEAVGTLAGGVAHDFNNMLAAILVNVALADQTLPPGSPAGARLRLAQRAAERARALVRQILTFSRHTPIVPQVQPLQPLVDEAVALLRSTLPPTVRLVVRNSRAPLWASVDAAQFQQTVVNLCTNAWQALAEERGRVRVSLVGQRLTPPQAKALGLAPGEFVRLRVADTGQGMDDAVRARIFEPFFTTKPVGTGTGLGLAVVHGVVRDSGGAIEVRSRPGHGTAITIYLPCLPEPETAPAAAASPLPAVGDRPSGRVIYVDDDEVVSLSAAALLCNAGLEVTCMQDGPAVLAALRAAPGTFPLVITDYNMPDMSGLALAAAIRQEAPQTAVVIVSGLVTEDLRADAGRLGVHEVVFKEHMLDHLVDAARRALAPA